MKASVSLIVPFRWYKLKWEEIKISSLSFGLTLSTHLSSWTSLLHDTLWNNWKSSSCKQGHKLNFTSGTFLSVSYYWERQDFTWVSSLLELSSSLCELISLSTCRDKWSNHYSALFDAIHFQSHKKRCVKYRTLIWNNKLRNEQSSFNMYKNAMSQFIFATYWRNELIYNFELRLITP